MYPGPEASELYPSYCGFDRNRCFRADPASPYPQILVHGSVITIHSTLADIFHNYSYVQNTSGQTLEKVEPFNLQTILNIYAFIINVHFPFFPTMLTKMRVNDTCGEHHEHVKMVFQKRKNTSLRVELSDTFGKNFKKMFRGQIIIPKDLLLYIH